MRRTFDPKSGQLEISFTPKKKEALMVRDAYDTFRTALYQRVKSPQNKSESDGIFIPTSSTAETSL